MPENVVDRRRAELQAKKKSREETLEKMRELEEELREADLAEADETALENERYRRGAPIRWAALVAAVAGLILSALILQLKENNEGLTAAEMLSRFVFSFSVWAFFLLAFHLFDRLAVPEFNTYEKIRESPVAVALYWLGHCVLFGACVAFG